ncbi:hypothetical protein GCM10009558_032840 [Virgisporangium aurantiacum]
MDFVILGRTALHADGRPVDLGAAKQRALLAMLLFHVRVPVRTDTLLHQLWGDQPTPRSNLYALVSRTRRVLDGIGRPDALVRVDSGYRLDLDPDLVDFHRFRRLVARARDAAPAAAAAMLVEAIGFWRGEPLADLRGPYTEQLRNHMHDELVEAHKLLADHELTLGQPHRVLARLEPFVLDRDLDEALAEYWMRALAATGRVDDARTFSVQFRKRFRRRLHTDSRVTMPAFAGAGAVPRPAAPVPRQLPMDVVDFTGHEDLLHDIDDAAGVGIVVLSGMPGVGKTTLAVHWAHRNRDRFPDGQLYLNANAFGTGPDLEPARALGRFLSALGVAADQVPGDVDERRDLFNDLLADRRVLLVLDNVRTTEQVRPLIPTTGPCAAIVTSRNRLRGLSIREGARCITVPPLSASDSTALLTAVIGPRRAAADPDGVQELVRLTGGLPLAVRIVGEHVAERSHVPVGDLAGEFSRHLLGSDGDDEEARLETVFAWSYDALPPADSRLFRLLGLFPGPTLRVDNRRRAGPRHGRRPPDRRPYRAARPGPRAPDRSRHGWQVPPARPPEALRGRPCRGAARDVPAGRGPPPGGLVPVVDDRRGAGTGTRPSPGAGSRATAGRRADDLRHRRGGRRMVRRRAGESRPGHPSGHRSRPVPTRVAADRHGARTL